MEKMLHPWPTYKDLEPFTMLIIFDHYLRSDQTERGSTRADQSRLQFN